MKIYTSYFGNAKKLSKDGIRLISIARWQPKYLDSLPVILEVAPTIWMLKQASHSEYVAEYKKILSHLNVKWFLEQLEMIGRGADVALCCYEKPGEFCHRHMLAEYLTSQTGIEIPEYESAVKEEKPKKIEPPSLFDDF